jgi:hypothetical protein
MRKGAIALLVMAMLAAPMLAAGGPDSASGDGSNNGAVLRMIA